MQTARDVRSPSTRARRGMTLVEVMMAASVAAVCFAGIAGAVVQSRRLTESSILQNSTMTVIQGYLEQIKSMTFNEVPYYAGTQLRRGEIDTSDNVIYTCKGVDDPDPISISPGTPPDPATLTPGVVPTGAVDNYKIIDLSDTESTDDDLRLHLWIWITALDDDAGGVASSRAITVIYSWQAEHGARARHFIGSIRAIRSSVP